MTNGLLMPLATAVWLVENTTLTFKQIKALKTPYKRPFPSTAIFKPLKFLLPNAVWLQRCYGRAQV